MKYLKTFNQLNESLRDKMTGVSKENMLKNFLQNDNVEDILYKMNVIDDPNVIEYLFKNIPILSDDLDENISEFIRNLEYSEVQHDYDFYYKLYNIPLFSNNEILINTIVYYAFKNNDIDLLIDVLNNIDYISSDLKSSISIYFPDIKSSDKVKKLLSNNNIKNMLNEKQLYFIEKYVLGKHQNELIDIEKEVIDILEKLDYVKTDDYIIGKLDNKPYLKYTYKTKELVYHLDRIGLPFMKSKKDPSFSGFKYDLGSRYMDLVIGELISKHLNIEYGEIIGSRNDEYHFLNENKKEEKLKKQRKEEKLYLSQSERKRLNDLQKKSLIKKRKEKGSYNDEDFTNLHLF